MLGKLARWLRVIGYDTQYMQGEDAAIAHHAREEGRVLLTRDRELARRKGLRTVLIRADVLEAQLAEVIDEVGAPPMGTDPRCMQCNGPLVTISRQVAGERVPAYVLETHDTFQHCQECGRIYWRGTHWQGIVEQMGDRLEGAGRGCLKDNA